MSVIAFTRRAVRYWRRNRRYWSALKLANAAAAQVAMRLRLAYNPAMPVVAKIEATNICNGTCRLCPVGRGEKTGRACGKISWDRYCSLIDRVAPWVHTVDLTNWGESLLHPRILEMIAYAHRANLYTYLSTNLHTFRPGHIDGLMGSGLDELTLSLHGLSSETYAAYQPGFDFQEACKLIDALVEARHRHHRQDQLKITLNFVVTACNEHEAGLVEEFARQRGVDCAISEASLNLRFLVAPELVREDCAAAQQKVAAQAAIWLPKDPQFVRSLYHQAIKEPAIIFSGCKRAHCDWPWTKLVVNWDGGVSACCGSYYACDDVARDRGQPLRRLWNSPGLRACRASFAPGRRRRGKHEAARVLCALPGGAAVIATLQRLRVMHILHSLDGGGAERIVCDLARRGDIQTAVICLDHLGSLSDEAARLCDQIHCTHRRAGGDWRQVGRIARLIRDWQPHVIHAHQYTPYLYGSMAATVAGFGRIIFTEHGRHWPDRVGPLRKVTNQLLRLRRDRMTAVCQFAADALRGRERIAGRDVQVIPNGIDWRAYERPPRRQWLRQQIGAASDAPLLIQVARLRPVKDHATSLQAFSLLLPHHPDARLLIVGDGPQLDHLESLARKLKIDAAAHFLGRRDDVPDLLAACDSFILSSLSEAASLSIMEAMAAGLPVAATDVGGNAEIVQHCQTGLLSPRGNAVALASNLRLLLDRPDFARSLGAEGRRRIRRDFDQRQMHQAFFDLYRQMALGAA